MNDKGREFCSLQDKRFKQAAAILGSRPEFSWSQIVERVMRLGIESKVFDLDGPPAHNRYAVTDDLENMAVATLKQDFANRILPAEDFDGWPFTQEGLIGNPRVPR